MSMRSVLTVAGDREQRHEQPGQHPRSGEASPRLTMTGVALGEVRQPFAVDLVLEICTPLSGNPGQHHRMRIDDHHTLLCAFGAGFTPRVSFPRADRFGTSLSCAGPAAGNTDGARTSGEHHANIAGWSPRAPRYTAATYPRGRHPAVPRC